MKKKTAFDYKFIRLLGEGSFSSVYLAVDANITSAAFKSLDNSQNESGIELESDSSETNQGPTKGQIKFRKYAIKVCQKSHIKREGKQAAIMREKEIMNVLNQHPNEHFIRLYCTFQDIDRLYFVMTYAENGDLLTYMQEEPLHIDSARDYTIQLINALEHLHKLGIVHRDLKPENILLNEHMRILVSDFGSAQIYSEDDKDFKPSSQDRRNSFVGTAQYVSPEMLKSRQATNKSDLWAFGVIIYQMITNVMPFQAPNEYLIYQKILNLDYKFPDSFDYIARDLITSLVRIDPMERLGASDDLKNAGYKSIRDHGFLKDQVEGTASKSIKRVQHDTNEDTDLVDIDDIKPGLDEVQLLRILTIG